MKRKKTIWIIIGAVIAFITVGIICFCIIFSSKYKLAKRLSELLFETYTYSVTCTVKGMDLPVLGNEFEGKMTGSKGEEVLFGKIYYDDYEYLELYVDSEYNMIFNVEPLFERMLNLLEEKSDLSLSFLNIFLGDINISLDQLEEVIDKDIITISDSGISSEVFESISGSSQSNIKYSLSEIKDISDINKLLGDEAIYFLIQLENSDTSMIIGISDSEREISVEIIYDDITWEFVCEYELDDVREKEMPKETLSNNVIKTLQEIYSYWLDIKKYNFIER